MQNTDEIIDFRRNGDAGLCKNTCFHGHSQTSVNRCCHLTNGPLGKNDRIASVLGQVTMPGQPKKKLGEKNTTVMSCGLNFFLSFIYIYGYLQLYIQTYNYILTLIIIYLDLHLYIQ